METFRGAKSAVAAIVNDLTDFSLSGSVVEERMDNFKPRARGGLTISSPGITVGDDVNTK